MSPAAAHKEPRLIGIVVPAKNEAELIGDCLLALERAADHRSLDNLPVRIVLVLDSCSDASEAAAFPAGRRASNRLEILYSAAGNVGAARRSGFAHLLSTTPGTAPEEIWLASTDADSQVPADWLARQLAWRREGVEAIAGTVELIEDSDDRAGELRRRYESFVAPLGRSDNHRHVHGANMSFSADAYLRAGGFAEVATGEDHLLWAALAAAGARQLAVGGIPVRTSGRLAGRAPDGFAVLLADLASSP